MYVRTSPRSCPRGIFVAPGGFAVRSFQHSKPCLVTRPRIGVLPRGGNGNEGSPRNFPRKFFPKTASGRANKMASLLNRQTAVTGVTPGRAPPYVRSGLPAERVLVASGHRSGGAPGCNEVVGRKEGAI